MVITIRGLEQLVDRKRAGTPVGQGWGVYHVHCACCGSEWVATAIVNTRSEIECPYCSNCWRMTWLTVWGAAPSDGNLLEPVLWDREVIRDDILSCTS